jgi:FAD/FMN-containing dehydrogenase
MATQVIPVSGTLLNDVHARLNPTRPAAVHRPRTLAQVSRLVRQAVAASAAGDETHLSIAGGRHAMGGQQFATGATHIDTTGLNRLLDFDSDRGEIEVEAGMMWPRLIELCRRLQPRESQPWTIAQKQTGADRMTIGGSLSANIHGRGLDMSPLVADIEALTLVDAAGEVRSVSRQSSSELFSLIVGGYGLFGIVYSVRLRLKRRLTLQRHVVLARASEVPDLLRSRIADGYVYGDLQFAIDPEHLSFLDLGVCSCYRPVEPALSIPEGQRRLEARDWMELLYLAHVDKSGAFRRYSQHYLATSGQLYHSDTAQLAMYLDDYHTQLDTRLCCAHPGTESISEVCIPLDRLPEFMNVAAAILRSTHADVVYGTVRLIRADTQTFLPWARRDYACMVLNLHTPHTAAGLETTASSFRLLIDAAIQMGGSFYLTYHRHATADQILACYPQFPSFLAHKERFDPQTIFDSDWHRHYRAMFDGMIRQINTEPDPSPSAGKAHLPATGGYPP